MLDTFKKLPRARQWGIVNKIAWVFAKKGYFNANIPQICKEAGISTGALYKYFQNKEDIYRSVFEFQYRATERLYSLDEGGGLWTKKSVFTAIKELLERLARVAEQYPQYLIIYYDMGSPSMSMFSESAHRIEELSKSVCLRIVHEG